MKATKFRILCLFLAGICLAIFLLPGVLPVHAAAPEYQNTYVNTGNQRADILGVALTQVGYTEGESNDTKYGTWNNLPYQPWCASFVSWCARQAEISTDILNKSGLARPSYFGIPYYSSSHYTPQPGDLFFTKGFTHVGLVYQIEGDYFYSIEGNGNNDFSTDGYYVIINKRLISDYYYGVPAYEGCDAEHDYVRGQDAAHPHDTYYQCQTCGDKYYTGYSAVAADCGSFLNCGCSEAYAGYYLCDSDTMPLRVWDKHSKEGDPIGRVPDGAVVYVYGGTGNGWAYIEYDGLRGHVQMQYLKAYYAAPDAPVISTDRAAYVWDDNVTITWNQDTHAEEYRLEILRDGQPLVDENMGVSTTYTLEAAPAGEYEIRVSAANRTGWSQAGTLQVLVRDTYTVSFDAAGGSGAPAGQTEVCGTALALTDAVPLRDGFTFLGWTDEPGSSFAKYKPGGPLLSDGDLTLYAVWKDDSAVAQALEIEQLPRRTQFLIGECLDTAELSLRITYSDGSGHTVTEGFTAEGFSAGELGIKTITISCEGLTVTYEIEIVDCIPGDINLDTSVTRDDVMQLLWHITFPAEFPIETPADFTGDAQVDRDDVMQLLWHITFPSEFPLDVYIN